MSDERFELHSDEDTIDIMDLLEDEVFNFQFDVVSLSDAKRLVLRLNRLSEENEQLKKRVYDFEKRKIIEESEIDEDVIPKIKLLRSELFGEKYE